MTGQARKEVKGGKQTQPDSQKGKRDQSLAGVFFVFFSLLFLMLDFIDLTLTSDFFHFDSLTHNWHHGSNNTIRKWKALKYFLMQRIGGNCRISEQKTSGRGHATGSEVNCQVTLRAGQLSGPLAGPLGPPGLSDVCVF